jgi:hypothetical protein
LVDLRGKIVKYLERVANIHHRPRYMLTYNGVHLNKEGNVFIASIILKHFGYIITELDNNNNNSNNNKDKFILEYVDDSILYKVLDKHRGINNLGGKNRFHIKDSDRASNHKNSKRFKKNDEL